MGICSVGKTANICWERRVNTSVAQVPTLLAASGSASPDHLQYVCSPPSRKWHKPSGTPIKTHAGTFLALEDVAAVSWLPAGVADRHGPLSTQALGLRAGTEVTGALWRHGGAAATGRRVAPGQDRTLGARGHRQIGTRHPGASELL